MSIVIPAFFMMNQYWNWYVSSETVEENACHGGGWYQRIF